MSTDKERKAILYAFDSWIVKSLIWYVIVVVAFCVIMLDTGSNMLIGLIASGILTFILLFWWRTLYSDYDNLFNPYLIDNDDGRKKAKELRRKKHELEKQIKANNDSNDSRASFD